VAGLTLSKKGPCSLLGMWSRCEPTIGASSFLVDLSLALSVPLTEHRHSKATFSKHPPAFEFAAP
jgi:hypothetical protein